MSYILEALKKLEEKRRKTETPLDLLADRRDRNLMPGRHRLLPYLLAAALSINAGLLLWWHPWRPVESGAVQAQAKDAVAASRAIPTDEDASAAKSAGSPEAASAISRPEGATTRPEASAATEGRTAETGETRAGSAGSVSAATGEDWKVYALNDLPASVRRDLPEITVSGHFYSPDPSARIIVINGRTMREGQAVSGSLRLEKITPDGIVMSYQGYHFRRGVF